MGGHSGQMLFIFW